MSDTVYLVVLLAALLHAGWNASIRGARDRSDGMTAEVRPFLLLGLTVLGERLKLMKVAATFSTLAGAALLRLARG